MTSRSIAAAGSVVVAIAAVAACSSFSAEDSPVTAGPEGGADAPILPESAPPRVEAGADATVVPSDGVALAIGFQQLSAVAATETTVYFADQASGVISSVPLAGGASPTTFASDPQTQSPSGLAIVGDVVYWSDFGKGKLGRRDVKTGASRIVAVPAGLSPTSIVGTSLSSGNVVVTAISGGLGSVLLFDLDLSGPTTFRSNLGNPFDIAISGVNLYWTESAPGNVWAGMLGHVGDEARLPLPTAESDCQSIAADDRGIYWTLNSGGEVRMTVPRGATAKSLATAQKGPLSIAADDSGVYWLTTDGKLRRSTRDELPVQTISQYFAASYGGAYVQGIALTKDYIVWLTSDGKVLRHAKQ